MVKRFIKYYKNHRGLFILDLFCAFGIAALDLVFPMITRRVMKDINEGIDITYIKTLGIFTAILIGLYAVKYIFNYIVHYWGHVVGVRMQYDMRKDIFKHLQTLPVKYFDDNKTGQIMSRIVNDLMQVSELAHHGPEDLFISLVMFIGSFILLCTINVKLTIIVFAFLPVLLYFASKKRVKMARAFKEVRKKIANVNAQLENSISGIRVSKSFTNEEYEIEKFKEGNEKFKNARTYAYKYMAEFASGVRFITDVLNVVVIFAGGIFLVRGEIQVPDLATYFIFIGLFMQPIRRLTGFIEQYQSGMAGFERFAELMDIEPEVIDKDNAIDLEKVVGDIEFKNVSFQYDDNKSILSDLSLNIKHGETLALVGPSGGGKTTICQLLPRFYEINEGEITVDNVNIHDVKLKSLRQNIGIVQQDVFLFTGTIKENILYGRPDATDEEIIEAAKKANIHEFIMTLKDDYDTYVGERGVKLSGGQKQRISIARVFLKNPPILILDEATSALDNESEAIIQKSLEELSKGRTAIIVAHRLSTIKNADNIIVITSEGIAEKGTHEELMSNNGIYTRLYNAQFKGFIPDEI
ncbi:ABC transporter ATP-binding protein [Oceanirhabdus sp. W0125-5]|uniref:ABC transporter ATP-binding protein n=1 Tax=Oceanirhabdus sp. W0125-5 TaxID=2999116 RepID=UPI0022F2DE34|nr:ABC transporter ATP-binding protein [Oceanirhabdus sp. W0125-5]WBW97963.1 ABC transporter ATP-binding protein [Oceanirhabdus sp. W0125-5]